MKNKFQEIRERWNSESDPFFKKITNAMIAVGAVSAAIVTLPATLPIVLPATLITVASYGAVAGTLGAMLGKLTKK